MPGTIPEYERLLLLSSPKMKKLIAVFEEDSAKLRPSTPDNVMAAEDGKNGDRLMLGFLR